ncbi:membrane-bound PQQ-dependent dehydrogenase, glucose/quinate/shikimate family [Paracoccus sp. S3-43]|uniref:membrane-bound PQQ-dependent dehydrogenase, glucose/quinate/shikimate family n=1 Tax=Paracoccus sp. S3-43 TaxID=3030011 RepID=UPI0023AE936D|nr:membrane-bound PQQ-dependent dehydrogenase, glucose/quinate/shikimate family [Paracoccus sp. S3-43]WEF24353.1 membrane-bound PQQ-dependent dehydrogenase, glucose/quinate/shikimate family [Paracoccus sp. S3-43]
MRIFLTLVFGIIGAALLAGGIYLAILGGSPFIAVAGAALLLVALLAFVRSPVTHWAYAGFLIALSAWSWFDAGYDWWALASRMGMFLILGLLLLLPFGAPRQRSGRVALLAVAVIAGLGLLGSLATDPHEIKGTLPDQIANADPDMGPPGGPEDWLAYGRTDFGQRYSPLDQITAENVAALETAWTYRTGDLRQPGDTDETTYQATPIKIGNTLYLCTPHNWLVALDADTGAERWVYKADISPLSQRQHQTCRGVSYWPGDGGAAAPSGAAAVLPADTDHPATPAVAAAVTADATPDMRCDTRLFMPTSDAHLLALDPTTGELCADFADNGSLNLIHNMPFRQAGFYYSTSPPVIVGNALVVGGAVNDNYDIDAPSGVIRAYDVRDGRLLWNWDSGNPGATEPFDVNDPAQVYTPSSPNSWAPMSADPALGLVYVPMGNRTPDQLGMFRNEAEETYASSVVALDAATGQARWVQQFVHHDLWDMDTPAQPTLLDLDMPQGRVPALVVPTKQGDVYVLNRETGEPILPVTERPAPQGTVPEDFAAPTQPVSALSFEPEPLTESQMWGATLIDQMLCRIRFRQLRYEGRYTPPSLQGTIVYPGNFGVFNWGGIAVDPRRQVMFGMPLQLAFTSRLVPADQAEGATNSGEQGLNSNTGAPYAIEMGPFLSPLGVPCQQPPWGFVAGADLRTGEIAWKHRNATTMDMTPLPIPLPLGMPGIGGPVVTGSGVVFLAAAVDNYIRAYDLTTGQELWRGRLPAGGQATPMTYLDSQGRQVVVLVAGGHGSIGTDLGDHVLAWRLPAGTGGN